MLKDNLLKLFRLIPIQNTMIFEASPDLADSTYYLFKYLVETYEIQKKYKLVWFIREDQNARDSLLGVPITCVNNNSRDTDFKTKLRRLYYNYTARVIIDGNMYVYKKRPGQIRIYVDHGMPLKEAVEYQSNIGTCDLITVSGHLFAEEHAKYADPASIRIYGLPRDEELYDLKRENVEEKKIIWMPTFRQHKNKTGEPVNVFPMGIPLIKTPEQLQAVNRHLQEKHMKLILRLHPAQDTSVLKVGDMSNLILADNAYLKSHGMMLEDLLKDTDALITDYSSVYWDYLYTGRPIGLTFEDVQEYQKTMPLIFDDVEKELPGRQMLTAEDLIAFIDEVSDGKDPWKQQRADFMQKIGMEKFESRKLIGNFLMEKLREVEK